MPWRSLGRARIAMWPVLELSMTVGLQILLTPLLLHRLGPAQFGVWVIVQSLLLASSVLSLGAGAGMLPVLSGALHRGDAAATRAAMRWFFRRVAWVAAAVLAGLALVLALDAMPAGVTQPAQGQLWPLALAVLAWMTLTELDNAVVAALKAHGRFALAAQTETAARLAQLGLTYAWVGVGSTALVAVLPALAVGVLKLALRLAALRRQTPATSAAAGTTAALTRELVVTGTWIWVGTLGSLAFNALDRWLVGAWFGSSVLTAYAVCTQLAQLPHALVSAAGNVLVPWSARQADRPRAALKMLASATALAALPSLLLLPLLQPLLTLWISESFALEHLRLAQGLTLVFLLLALNVPGFFLLLGMGRARRSTVVVSACGAVFALGALVLPRELSVFVALKALFAALALTLPIGCALLLKAKSAAMATSP